MHLAVVFAGARGPPTRQPGIHAQRRVEGFQRQVEQATGRMPEQQFGGLIGVAHAAVPVEPEDADSAVIETELRQPLRFLGRLAQFDVAACGLQPTFQQAMLTSLPGQHQQAGQQQYAQQQGQASPVADLAPEVDAARLEPLFLQLAELPSRELPQRGVEHRGELGAVAPRSDPQQLRVAQVADHCQSVVFELLRQTSEQRLVDDRVAGLALQYLAQGIGLARRGEHGDIGVVAGKELADRPRPRRGNQLAGMQVFQVDGAWTSAITDDQPRDAQERITVAPQAQPGRRLAQPGCHVDPAFQRRLLQCRLVVEAAPLQPHAEFGGKLFHQLHMESGQAPLTLVIFGIRRAHHHAHPPFGMLFEPGTTGGIQRHGASGKRRGQAEQKKEAQG